jgi:hypothetical protein
MTLFRFSVLSEAAKEMKKAAGKPLLIEPRKRRHSKAGFIHSVIQ